MDLQCTRLPYRTTAVHGIALTPLLSSSYPSPKLHVVPPLEMLIETNTHKHNLLIVQPGTQTKTHPINSLKTMHPALRVGIV